MMKKSVFSTGQIRLTGVKMNQYDINAEFFRARFSY